MGIKTAIPWCHHTFNIWRGCAKMHTGCTHCYAERNVGVTLHGIKWGEVWLGGDRVIKADSQWDEPIAWAKKALKLGQRRRVFCASLADVLEVPEVPASWPRGWTAAQIAEATERVNAARDAMNAARERLWEVIRKTAAPGFSEPHLAMWQQHPGLDWLILTKRPQNWRLIPEDVRPFVWLLTSISDQDTANRYVPELLRAWGFRVLGVSVEPMVAPVDLRDLPANVPTLEGGSCPVDYFDALTGEGIEVQTGGRTGRILPSLDWVIIGGESGSKARPCNVEWVRAVVRQCRDASIPCFVKQLGAVVTDSAEHIQDWERVGASWSHTLDGRIRVKLKDDAGEDMAEWPEALRVREFPHA